MPRIPSVSYPSGSSAVGLVFADRTLVLALILPSRCGHPRLIQLPIGSVFGWSGNRRFSQDGQVRVDRMPVAASRGDTTAVGTMLQARQRIPFAPKRLPPPCTASQIPTFGEASSLATAWASSGVSRLQLRTAHHWLGNWPCIAQDSGFHSQRALLSARHSLLAFETKARSSHKRTHQ